MMLVDIGAATKVSLKGAQLSEEKRANLEDNAEQWF